MSDKERVLKHLQERGSITLMDAMSGFGCYRLSARIWDLRHEGWDIRTSWETGTDMHGEPSRYARYLYRGRKEDEGEDDQLTEMLRYHMERCRELLDSLTIQK